MSVQAIIESKGSTVNVERMTETVDAAGSVLQTWAGHLSGIRIFIQPASGAEALRYGRESNRGFLLGYAVPGQDIVANDRITGSDLGSRIMDIQAVRTAGEFPVSNSLSHMVLELEETS